LQWDDLSCRDGSDYEMNWMSCTEIWRTYSNYLCYDGMAWVENCKCVLRHP
jgi:hypothetical protein